MDKLNIVQKTVVSIILATMVISVVVPILFFLTVAFSNDVEMTQFPKRIFSNFSVTVKVASGENGEYELFHDRGDGEGYRPIITTKNPTKLENHFKRQYGVIISGEELLKDFSATRENGPMEFKYRKDLFFNFKQFFAIVNNSGKALTPS